MACSEMIRLWKTGGTSWKFAPPLLLDMELVGCDAFVVEDLEVNTMAGLCETGHDTICGSEAVAVMAVFEWIHQD